MNEGRNATNEGGGKVTADPISFDALYAVCGHGRDNWDRSDGLCGMGIVGR